MAGTVLREGQRESNSGPRSVFLKTKEACGCDNRKPQALFK
jgi:hypothetical protein